MTTDVMWISFVLVSLCAIGLIALVYRLGATPINLDVSGIWLSESLNIRILLHDIGTEFQGSVIWADGVDKLLGLRIVENLKFDKSKRGKGHYSDPHTGKKYAIDMRIKKKGLLQIMAYHPNTEEVAFAQEWKQFES